MPGKFRFRSRIAGQAAAEAASSFAPHKTDADSSAAAFFDVDNTLMQGASIFHLARGLHKRKYFTISQIMGMAWKQAYFRIAGVEDPEHLDSAKASALSFVAGHRVSDLREIGEEIYDEYMAEKIWPGTRGIAEDHLNAGRRVWIVTAAPIEIGDTIARRLGLTGALGTVAEHVDGIYTGRLVGDMLHNEAKAEAIKALAELEGLDLSRCYAYSDSSNDLPMLNVVGHPTAINPDSKLRGHAELHGWPIIDYRTGRKLANISAKTFLTSAVVWLAAFVIKSAWRRFR